MKLTLRRTEGGFWVIVIRFTLNYASMMRTTGRKTRLFSTEAFNWKKKRPPSHDIRSGEHQSIFHSGAALIWCVALINRSSTMAPVVNHGTFERSDWFQMRFLLRGFNNGETISVAFRILDCGFFCGKSHTHVWERVASTRPSLVRSS